MENTDTMKRLLVLIFATVVAVNAVASSSDLDKVRRAFVDASAVTYAPNAEVTERFVHYSDNGRANDVRDASAAAITACGLIELSQWVDVPLTYADYYFLEALLRWRNIVIK